MQCKAETAAGHRCPKNALPGLRFCAHHYKQARKPAGVGSVDE
jgi:hypothetical protein